MFRVYMPLQVFTWKLTHALINTEKDNSNLQMTVTKTLHNLKLKALQDMFAFIHSFISANSWKYLV